MEPKVMVLMATYNGEKYLKKQLDSIFNQINVSVHVLVRDDGSTDQTLSILDDYVKEDYPITLTRAEASDKHGAMNNYYSLLKLAQNELTDTYHYFALSDQDDIWLPNKLDTLVKKTECGSKPQLTYGNYCVIDSNDNVSVTDVNSSIGIDFKVNLALLFNHSYVWGHSIIFNDALLKNICLDSEIRNSGFPHDAYLAKYAALCDGITYVSDVLVKYRRHSNNVSGMWYRVTLMLLIKKLNVIKEAKVYANVVNSSLLTIKKNASNHFADKKIISSYKEGLNKRGLQSLAYFRKQSIYRKQTGRNLNMKLMYATGLYNKWVFRNKKMVNL